MLFLSSVGLLFLTIAFCNSTTYEGRYLTGNALRILLDVDWVGCLQMCHDEPKCISYNYHKDRKICKINSDGEREGCGTEKTIVSAGWIYHQMRPTPKEPVKYELGDDPSQAAKSCQEIFQNRREASSQAYYIRLGSKTRLIYCKMVHSKSENEPCWGGWTLAMKIDGRMATFSYSNDSLWGAGGPYNEHAGNNLKQRETKLQTFNTLTLAEGFCVGMEVNGITEWLKIPQRENGVTAPAIFQKSDPTLVPKLDRQEWKSLINGSFAGETCSGVVKTEQGFNLHKRGARVRIGMVTLCKDRVVSMIGFGMSKNTSCGIIDTRSGKSIKAFCFIFVK